MTPAVSIRPVIQSVKEAYTSLGHCAVLLLDCGHCNTVPLEQGMRMPRSGEYAPSACLVCACEGVR